MNRRLVIGILVFLLALSLSCGGTRQAAGGRTLFSAGQGLEFKDRWDDGGATGATFSIDGSGRLVILGTSRTQTYGCVYTDLSIDLSEFGALELDVEGSSKGGFVLLQSSVFEKGFIPLNPSIIRPGLTRYDLRLQTGVPSGHLPVRLQVGVTTNTEEGIAEGETLAIRSIRLVPVAAPPGASERVQPVFSEGMTADDVYRFAATWDNGFPAGAEPGFEEGCLAVLGTNDKDGFGAIMLNSTVDLDRFGGLEMDVKSVTKGGYVILSHPSLAGGFARAIPDFSRPGKYTCDLRRMLGRGGLATIKLQIGVTSLGTARTAVGQKMLISRLVFTEPPIRHIESVARQGLPTAIERPLPPAGAGWPDPSSLTGSRFPLPGLSLLDGVAPGAISDLADRVVIRSALTEVAFAKSDGRILAVKDLVANRDLARTAALFSIETEESGIISSSDAVAQGFAACAVEAGSAEVFFRYKFAGHEVNVRCAPERGGVGLSAEVKSNASTIRSLTLPDRLLFQYATLEEAVTPRWLGIGLNAGFFRSGRVSSFQYPAGFADLLHARFASGHLALLGGGLPGEPDKPGNWMQYRGRNIRGGSWTGLRPATLSVGGEGPLGFFTRILPMRLAGEQEFQSGSVLIAAGLPLSSAADLYRTRIYPADVKSLSQRLGEERFRRFASGALIKADFGSYPNIDRVIEDLSYLPDRVFLHPVTYWPKGFDRNYPDFYPADERFGGDAGLARVVEAAHARGMLVAPYVNPTWWNPSPTASRIGLENFAVRNADGNAIEDVYGENRGWMASPWFQAVDEVRQGLVLRTLQLGMDGVFEDQIGARDWRDDYAAATPAPLSYAEAMRRWGTENPQNTILMTENGFDAIAPGEHGLCGMWRIWAFGNDADLDGTLGAGNWRVVPVSSMISHDLASFMQHNLAVEVKVENDLKLSWNTVYGFHLYQILHNNLPLDQAAWILAAQTMQEEVLSRIIGRRMTEWSESRDGVVWTAYEGGTGVVANLGERPPLDLPAVAVPRGGFLAGDASLAAGVFSSVGGYRFAEPKRIVFRREAVNRVLQINPDGSRGFTAVPRDPSWTEDAGLRCERLDGNEAKPWPVALTDRGVIFLHQPRQARAAQYRVISETAGWDVRVRGPVEVIAGSPVKIDMEIVAETRTLGVKAAGLSAFAIGMTGPVPDANLVEAGRIENVDLEIDGGRGRRLTYQVEVPPDMMENEMLWLTAKVKTDRGERSVSTIVNVLPGVVVQAEVPPVIGKGDTLALRVTVTNRMPRNVRGGLELLVDGETFRPEDVDTEIPVGKGRSWTGTLRGRVLKQGVHSVAVRFTSVEGLVAVTRNYEVKAVPPLTCIDLAGRNLVPPEGMTTFLRLVAPQGRGFSGTALLAGENGWATTPTTLTVNVPPGGDVKIPVRVTPGSKHGAISVRFAGQDTGLVHKEPFLALEGTLGVLRGDLNGDGLEEISFGHAGFEAQVIPSLGGRIILLAGPDGVNHLFAPHPAVPKPGDPRAWAEYGGINDWWPEGWPGEVWNKEWSVSAAVVDGSRARVAMAIQSDRGLTLRRNLIVHRGWPVVVAEYEIGSTSDTNQHHVWASHPDIAVGGNGAGPEDRLIVPVEGGVQVHDYRARITKFSYRPAAGWVAAQDRRTQDYLAILFEPGTLSEIGLWEGGNFFTVEPIHPRRTVEPGTTEFFRVGYGVGKGDPLELLPGWSRAITEGRPPPVNR